MPIILGDTLGVQGWAIQTPLLLSDYKETTWIAEGVLANQYFPIPHKLGVRPDVVELWVRENDPEGSYTKAFIIYIYEYDTGFGISNACYELTVPDNTLVVRGLSTAGYISANETYLWLKGYIQNYIVNGRIYTVRAYRYDIPDYWRIGTPHTDDPTVTT